MRVAPQCCTRRQQSQPLHCSIHPARPPLKKTSPITLHTNYSAAPSRYRAPPDLRHSAPVKAVSHGVGSHGGGRWKFPPIDWKKCWPYSWGVASAAPLGAARASAAAPAPSIAATAAAAAASQTEGGSAVCNVSFLRSRPSDFLPILILSSPQHPRHHTLFAYSYICSNMQLGIQYKQATLYTTLCSIWNNRSYWKHHKAMILGRFSAPWTAAH